MKAVVIHEAGGPEKLVFQEVPTPEVKQGWSLVKIKGLGINHSEIFTREGKSPNVEFPRILGIEVVGEIAETTDAKRLPVGKKVVSIMGGMGREFDGSYAEYVLLPNRQIYSVQTNLPWELLAAVPETYYTAYGSMLNLQLKARDRVLIRGGTSGVGLAFMKLAKAGFPDIFVTGTTRRQEKFAKILEAGFDDVIADQENELQTDKTFDKILELIGPKSIKDSFEHIDEHGIICSVGQLGGQWCLEEFDPIVEIKNNSYLTTFHSHGVTDEKINSLLHYIEKHSVDVAPEKVFSLDEVSRAHGYLESSESFGKVVMVND